MDNIRNIPIENKMSIKIIGIGGGGCNAIKRLVKREEDFKGIEFWAANTDAISLNDTISENSDINIIQLGAKMTKGNGAGSKPEVGKYATEETIDIIEKAIGDASLLFITAGMGGGTGTGGAPVIARIAHEKQILTIGVVTLPFDYEGANRLRIANEGIAEMRKYVDIMIVVSNQKAFELCKSDTPMQSIFEKADDVLVNSIKGITDIIVNHSLINPDFADISTVIKGKKTAHIGIGTATGENRMFKALRMACNNELLNTTIENAKNIIINIVADNELSGEEVNKALMLIPKVVASDAMIIHGLGFDRGLKNKVCVTIIATGLDGEDIEEYEVEDKETNELIEQIENDSNNVNNANMAINSFDEFIKKLQEKK